MMAARKHVSSHTPSGFEHIGEDLALLLHSPHPFLASCMGPAIFAPFTLYPHSISYSPFDEFLLTGSFT